jgi:anti-anti-sigma regulatory factor
MIYDDPQSFRDEAEEFLAAGAELGERTVFLSRGDAVRAYGTLHRMDPEEQVACFRAQLDDARRDGFRGVRVAIDVSDVASAPDRALGYARYEHLLDRALYDTDGLRSLCGFDRDTLGREATDELAALHPVVIPEPGPFQLHAGPGTSLVISGELDASSEATLVSVLRHVGPTSASERVIIDATGLQFVDHRALCALEDFARTHDTTVVLRGAHRIAATICALLELDRVVVEDAV